MSPHDRLQREWLVVRLQVQTDITQYLQAHSRRVIAEARRVRADAWQARAASARQPRS